MTEQNIITSFVFSTVFLMMTVFILILVIINQRMRFNRLQEEHNKLKFRKIDLIEKKIDTSSVVSPIVSFSLIMSYASENKYDLIDYQKNIGMVSFLKDEIRINIYLTKMTVATVVPHPKKGSNQLYRKKVDAELMKAIFINPRVHTGKGYREKVK